MTETKEVIHDNIYRNASGKIIGTIEDSRTYWSVASEQYETDVLVNIEGIGTWTIKVNEDLNDERIRDIAAYYQVCIEGKIEELQDRLDGLHAALIKLGIEKVSEK